MDFQEISTLIEVHPTGVNENASVGNVWGRESQLPRCRDLESHIRSALEGTTSDLSSWAQLAKWNPNIFIGVFGDLFFGWDLSSSLVQELGERGLRLSFDVYAGLDSGER